MDNKLDYFKKLIALNDLELFFDQILEEIKIYHIKKKSNQLNGLSNQIILLSQNYFSVKKDVRLSLISVENYREQNNKIIAGLLEIVDELSKNSEFDTYVNQDKDLVEKYSFEESNNIATGLQIERGIEAGRIYPISYILKDRESIKIGRLDVEAPKNNDINITENDSFMSRKHATILRKENSTFVIKDGQRITAGLRQGWQQSLNGLFVNDKEVGIEGVVLNIDDRIIMGGTILKVIEL